MASTGSLQQNPNSSLTGDTSQLANGNQPHLNRAAMLLETRNHSTLQEAASVDTISRFLERI